jgi:hypothetical protein
VAIGTERAIENQQPLRGALPVLEDGEGVTFADLVLAHHLRQWRLYNAAQSDASSTALGLAEVADRAYKERLARFQAEHGTLARAYWCTYQISAVAIGNDEPSASAEGDGEPDDRARRDGSPDGDRLRRSSS